MIQKFGGQMKIVRFKDGTYGVRKGWFKLTYRYKDLSQSKICNRWWWSINSYYFHDCKVSSIGQITTAINEYLDYGTPVEEPEK